MVVELGRESVNICRCIYMCSIYEMWSCQGVGGFVKIIFLPGFRIAFLHSAREGRGVFMHHAAQGK